MECEQIYKQVTIVWIPIKLTHVGQLMAVFAIMASNKQTYCILSGF